MAAALILTLTMGSIHAFSVLLASIETRFDTSRTQAGLSYSIALICLTVSVLAGVRIYRLASPAWVAAGACVVASIGVVLAAAAPTIGLFWTGYGLVFGGANGVAYGFALVLAAQAYPKRHGLAMGTATATYAIGAAIFAPIFDALINIRDLSFALLALAVTVFFAGLACWTCLRDLTGTSKSSYSQKVSIPMGKLVHLWLAYGLSVAAGLMAIGHATGIIDEKLFNNDGHADVFEAWFSIPFLGAIGIAAGNAIGGIVAGALSDRFRPNHLLIALNTVSFVAIAVLSVTQNLFAMLLCFAVIGFGYGAIIAAFPPIIVNLVGIERYASVYGRVFTAWGTFGLLAPWIASLTFDRNGDYEMALVIAMCTALVGAALNFRLPAVMTSKD